MAQRGGVPAALPALPARPGPAPAPRCSRTGRLQGPAPPRARPVGACALGAPPRPTDLSVAASGLEAPPAIRPRGGASPRNRHQHASPRRARKGVATTAAGTASAPTTEPECKQTAHLNCGDGQFKCRETRQCHSERGGEGRGLAVSRCSEHPESFKLVSSQLFHPCPPCSATPAFYANAMPL